MRVEVAHLRWAAPVAECCVCADDFVHLCLPWYRPLIVRIAGMADYLPGHHARKYRKQTKSLTSSAEKPPCDRNPLEGALGMWSLSPHLCSDHRGNSMKIRMRFIQNGQWRQQKGCDKKWRHRRLRFVFGVSFGVTLGVKKKKARGLTPLTCAFDGGRYKIRTCDPIRVKDMLYP